MADTKGKSEATSTIWILITNTGNHHYLTEAIRSAKSLFKNEAYKVVVSLDSSVPGDYSDCIMYKRDAVLSQMDHYELLAKELPIQDEDRVMLLDGNDMLLPSALTSINNGSYIGLQIILPDFIIKKVFSEEKNSHETEQTIIRFSPRASMAEDFSGTTTSGSYFKLYFLDHRPSRSSATRLLEDIHYMDFIEHTTDYSRLDNPTVIHRISAEKAPWQGALLSELEALEAKVIAAWCNKDMTIDSNTIEI